MPSSSERVVIRKSRPHNSKPDSDGLGDWRVSWTSMLTGVGPPVVPKNEDWNRSLTARRRSHGKRHRVQGELVEDSDASCEVIIDSGEEADDEEPEESQDSDLEVNTSGSEADVSTSSQDSESTGKDNDKSSDKKHRAGHSKTKDQADSSAEECLKKMKKKGTAEICLKKKQKSRIQQQQQKKKKTETSDSDSDVQAETSDSDSKQAEKKTKKSGEKAKTQNQKKTKPGETSTDAETAEAKSDSSPDALEDTSAGAEASNSSDKNSNRKPERQKENGKKAAQPANAAKQPKQATRSDKQPVADWTPSDDQMILSMKAGGETWADIGKQVARGKKEVQKRWKELQEAGDSGAARGQPTIPLPADNNVIPTQSAVPCSTAAVAGGYPLPPPSPSPTAYYAAQQQQQAAYRAALARLYPARVALQPDGDWSGADCEVLAALDAKHRLDRWLELQAGFYNATGRMVPVEALRAKFGEAAEGKGMRRDGRVG